VTRTYAFALRAPFLLLSNGSLTQIWQLQLTGETEMSFECTASELLGRRGEVEALINKSAAVEHCQKLSWKQIQVGEFEVMPYLDSLSHELPDGESLVPRQIVVRSNETTQPSSWTLEQYPGVVIVAPSGHGKSTLCAQLAAVQALNVTPFKVI
jgi:hypothetical protein